MATIHMCDICGEHVRSRTDLWSVEIAPLEKREAFDSRKFEKWELCEKCKKRVYVAIHEHK